MVLKSLPESYKPFVVVVTQSEKQMTFPEFKVSLQNFVDTEKARTDVDDESVVMKAVGKTNSTSGNITCFACGERGHKSDSYGSKAKNKLWCNFCKTSTHSDKACRRKPKETTVKHISCDGDNTESHSFTFKFDADCENGELSQVNSLLVDCGATTHVVTDPSKFVRFDKQFNPENISLS